MIRTLASFIPGLFFFINPFALLIGKGSIKSFGENPNILIFLIIASFIMGVFLYLFPKKLTSISKLSIHFLFHCLFFGVFNRVTSFDNLLVWSLLCIAILGHFIVWKKFTSTSLFNLRLFSWIGLITLFFNIIKIQNINFNFMTRNYSTPIIEQNSKFKKSNILKPNILHIVLEKVSSKEALELINSDKDLSRYYRGFSIFPNTVSNYIFTKGSLGSLLQSKMIPDGGNAESFFQQAFTSEQALPSLLSKNGYMVNFVKSFPIVKNENIHNYIDLRSRGTKIYSDFYKDLIAIATYFDIFQQQFFPLKARYLTFFEFSKLRYVRERENLKTYLYEIEPQLEKNNRYTFLYYSRPHAPYFELSDCSDSFLLTSTNYKNSLKCSLKLIGEWLEHLRKTKAWEKTKIIIHSDHGRLGEIAFPLFMFKSDNEPKKELNHQAIELLDILPTITNMGNIEVKNEFFEGQNILSHKYREKKQRVSHFTWSQRSKLAKIVKHANCKNLCSEGKTIYINKNKVLIDGPAYRLEVTD
ncbi:MAG: hypothetical protein CME65_11405 [Halobacteriovoraceae bacterium]|nr:hypothetical protein [Halobacteriovoraceae bacterium]|tara:strand:+ start:8146 stop:9726 length:1581 start_codon:yes stop_codon:yes gene_type:complete